MADILLTCPACGKQTSVSEYVSEDTAACHACGKAIPIPQRRQAADGKLKLRAPAETQTSPTWPSIGTGLPLTPGGQQRKLSAGTRRDLRRVKTNRAIQALSWVVFIVLAAAMYYIRFRGGLPGVPPATLKLAGLVAIGIAYLVIIIMALRDNMFDGLLAIVVPCYPFYYLFFFSSALFLRAVVAALLVGFGYDLGLFLQENWLRLYNGINYWMQHV